MPPWVQQVANYLPFQWTFAYPIEALIGHYDPRDLLLGLVYQAAWIIGSWLVVKVVWHYGIRHFGAVGN
jgi:ABC-2 type transport system permease protein